MKQHQWIIGGVAFVFSTLAAYTVFKTLSTPGVLSSNRCDEILYTDILVAKEDIFLGAAISLPLFEAQRWPQEFIKPEFLTKEKATAESLQHMVAKRPISSGEPLTTKIMVDAKNQGALAALLAPNKRAVAVNVDPASINGGLIMPGDIVDVIITLQENTGTIQKVVSRTALCEVRVLALDQKLNATLTDISPDAQKHSAVTPNTLPRTVTLEVSPQEAETLTAVVRRGTLSLSLHSVHAGSEKCAVNIENMITTPVIETKEPVEAPKIPPPEVKETVYIVRGVEGGIGR